MDRRTAGDRHAEPGHRPAQAKLFGLSGHRSGADRDPQPVPGRRLRVQGNPLRCPADGGPGGAGPGPAREAYPAARPDVRASRPPSRHAADAAAGPGRPGAHHGAGPSHAGRRLQLRRFHRKRIERLAQRLCHDRDAHDAQRGARRYRHARPDARARRGAGIGGPGGGHRPGGPCDGHGPAGLPPAELCRNRPGIGDGVFVQGAARLLCAGR